MAKTKPSEQSWLDPILKLGWVSFFADVASEMAYPILPLFVVNMLGAPVQVLGYIEGAAEALVSFMKGWSGRHFDKTGKRLPFIQWGYGLAAIGKPIVAIAPGWTTVLFGRLTDRFGKGIRTTARDAVIADAAGKEHLGKAYGLHRAMDTAGAFVGVLLLLLLLSNNWGFRQIFWAAAVPGLISLGITFTVRDVRKAAQAPKDKPAAPAFRLRDLPAGYWRALFLTIMFAIANSSDQFILLRGNQLGFTMMGVVGGYLVYNFTYTVMSYPAGYLSDKKKIGRWWILGVGWSLYALVYLGFAHTTAPMLWPLFALYGCYMGLTDGVSKALVAQYAPEGAKGTALGFYYMATGFAVIAGNVLSGLVYQYRGGAAMFTMCACIATGSVVLIPLTAVVWRRKSY